MTAKDIYDQAVSKAHSNPQNEDAVRLAELAALVEMNLGRPLDRVTFRQLAEIEADLQMQQQRLADQLERGALEPDAYLARINKALAVSMERSVALLGNEQFNAIFGEAGRHPEGLIDPGGFRGATGIPTH
jgi:hypothetical protein